MFSTLSAYFCIYANLRVQCPLMRNSDVLLYKCKKTYQFKTRWKDDMVNSALA